jgi:ABC-type transport system involved in multi-copper enzyme maturation permease subunit
LRALVAKEWRELRASRAAWLVALAVGPLVGQAFITAVRTYAELSGGGAGRGGGALSEGLSPLDGIVVPTFGAYALVATLLLPFVAIRLVSDEKTSGALTLLAQSAVPMTRMVVVKFAVMLGAWVLVWLPGFVTLGLWSGYGGHLTALELCGVLLGHLLHGALIVAIAFAAAAIADGASSAAVIALGVTLGGWALDFLAGVQGGVAAQLSQFTPESMLRSYEQGEIVWAALLSSLAVTVLLLALASAWLRPGRSVAARWQSCGAALLVAALVVAGASRLRGSADVSEDRRHSLPSADARALGGLHGTLEVEAHLGPQDPRRVDLERGVLHKLQRVMDVHVVPVSTTATGMFDGGAGYGEVWYAWQGRRVMTRSTTLPIVLDMIYSLTRSPVPPADAGPTYSGYPLVAAPRGAALLCYVVWPVLVGLLWMLPRRRRRA